MDDDIIVEIWDDPVWTSALEALQRQGNPQPLAKLLCEGQVPPLEVTKALGILLDPAPGYVGIKLVVKTPKRGRDKAFGAIYSDRRLRQRILDVQKSVGKLESEIATLQNETGLSRSKLFEALRLDDREVVRRSQVILGRGPRKSSPRT
jgi:hypothetical protein